MSIEAMDDVVSGYPVGGNEMVIALALADCTTPEGELYMPSLEWLAQRGRITEQEVTAALAKITAAGWLAFVRRDPRGDAGTLYRFAAPK